MRVLKVLVGLLCLMPIAFGFAHQAMKPCAPQFRFVEPLTIAWIDCQSNYDEVVVMVNGSSNDVDLIGYQIDTRRGDQFRFQQTSINPNCCLIKAHDILRIHSGHRNLQPFSDPRDLHWVSPDGQLSGTKVWNDEGGAALLFSPEGDLIAHYEYGNLDP